MYWSYAFLPLTNRCHDGKILVLLFIHFENGIISNRSNTTQVFLKYTAGVVFALGSGCTKAWLMNHSFEVSKSFVMEVFTAYVADGCVWYCIAKTVSTVIQINGRRFTVDIFRFPLYEDYRTMTRLSMGFDLKNPIENEIVLLQVMVCQRKGNGPLLESIMTYFNWTNIRLPRNNE